MVVMDGGGGGDAGIAISQTPSPLPTLASFSSKRVSSSCCLEPCWRAVAHRERALKEQVSMAAGAARSAG